MLREQRTMRARGSVLDLDHSATGRSIITGISQGRIATNMKCALNVLGRLCIFTSRTGRDRAFCDSFVAECDEQPA